MAQSWVLVATNALEFGDGRTREEKRQDAFAKNKAFNRLMSKTKERTYMQMVSDAEMSYVKKQDEKVALLNAFSEKKLKSKALIKQAKSLKKKKAVETSA